VKDFSRPIPTWQFSTSFNLIILQVLFGGPEPSQTLTLLQKQGLAKPIYEIIVVKTQSDTAKYTKERIESFYYLAYYYFLQYAGTKNKEYAVTAIAFSNKVLAIDPKDEKSRKSQADH